MKRLSKKALKELFELAKSAKNDGHPLVHLFESFARKEGMAFGSVRNLYYKSISNGTAGNLTVKRNEYFTESAENELIAYFLRERRACGSIRKAAFRLANGDPVLALRYQNKYCNLLKKKRDVFVAEMKKMALSGEPYYNPYTDARRSVICKSAEKTQSVVEKYAESRKVRGKKDNACS